MNKRLPIFYSVDISIKDTVRNLFIVAVDDNDLIEQMKILHPEAKITNVVKKAPVDWVSSASASLLNSNIIIEKQENADNEKETKKSSWLSRLT